MLEIYRLGSGVLREKCTEITDFNQELRELESEMYRTLESVDGVGLAGPQVGVSKRIFVIEIPAEGIKKTFVNPQIVETSVETVNEPEGCLSIPGLEHEVIRNERVTVFACDTFGKPFTVSADGLLSRAIQHENDHLDGVLYIDRLDEEEKKRMERRFEKREKAKHKAKKRRG